jgi:hypothetical protein
MGKLVKGNTWQTVQVKEHLPQPVKFLPTINHLKMATNKGRNM